MKLFVDNHYVSNSPSKLDQWCEPNAELELALVMLRRSPLTLKERVPEGRGRVSRSMAVSHTPPSLRDTSPNLGEDLCISNLFSSNSR